MAKIQTSAEDGHVVRITLNDPPLNILDIAMLGELRDAFRSLPPDVAIVIIDAAGEKAFSAGASVQDHIGERVRTMLELFHDCFRILDRCQAVSIALVHGAALGGGCELAMGCDLVLASDRARFGQPEIQLGVFPPVAAWQLSHQLAPRKGLELLLTGDPIDAHTAASLGLVNAVFPAAEFETAAATWIERLRRHSPSTLRLTKRAFRIGQDHEVPEQLASIERLYLEELMKTEDANEGLEAFIEKRAPEWRGR